VCRTGIGLCPVAGFGISNFKSSVSHTRELISFEFLLSSV
jgi:hypothetical protein